MSSEESIPHLLYQSVLLEPLPDTTELKSTTTLWIGYQTSIKQGNKLYLHCRQCKIEEISINSVKCEFILNDGLRILSSNKKQTYLSEEMDLNYRAALEISRLGELEITIPDLSGSKTELPVPLPRPCPRDVIGRYDKLVKTYKSLVVHNPPRYREQRPDCSPLDMADPTNPNETTEENHLLQVKIVYSLSGSTSYAGVVFRQPSPLAIIYEPSKKKDRQQQRAQSKTETEESSSPVCIHSTSFTTGSLRDVDGVRCWLPCMDSLDQRAIYDISIVAPRHWRVACCGKKVSTFLLAPPDNLADQSSYVRTHGERKISRFFTPNRISAMSVGFYLGAVEMYKMPLYRVRSRLWVSLGLQDFVSTRKTSRQSSDIAEQNRNNNEDNIDGVDTGNDETDDESGSVEDEEDGNKVFLRPLDDSYYSAFKRTLPTQTSNTIAMKDEQEENIVYKKLRTNTGFISTLPQQQYQQQQTSKKHKPQSAPVGMVRSKLYERKVTHSTLGLDISLRLLHKFTGHKYDYDEFVFVFVYDLGTDFISYDGFTLVDARFLHSEAEVQMETPTHLMLLQAYLYAWLKSSLPVSAYDSEFILHGSIGYLLNFYAEEVYGEEDGRYRYQKMYDTVLSLEKQGQAFPLASFFPEQYEAFGLHYGVYLKCKSAVIFQLIENRVGGKEDMRIAIKQLIRSPPIYTPVNKPYKGANTDVVSNFQSLFETTGNMSPMSPSQTPPTPSMVNQALALNEERRQYRSYSEDGGSYGGMSPYSVGNRSPSTYAGNMSPMSLTSGNMSPYYSGYQGNISPYQGGNISPYHGGNISPYPYNRGGNISPYQGGNLSPYTGQGNMSPYAPYAMGAATPAYDAYAHTTRLGNNADTQALTYSPSRYELSHSPVVTSAEATDLATEKAAHLLASVPTTHFETATGTETTKNADGTVDSASSIVETEVNEGSVTVSNTDNTATSTAAETGGTSFYAAMAQRRERADSLGLAAAVTATTTAQSTKQTQQEHVTNNNSAIVSAASMPPLRIELNRQGSEGSASGSGSATTGLQQPQRDWSMLTFDCVTAESFILTVRHASGASADIDEDFLDRFVYNKGALFVRVYVTVSDKIEAKPRQISIFSQQMGHKDYDHTGKPVYIKDNLKVRIAEVRDDVVTEPYVAVCNKEEEFQQQAYTRPGRRGGKRRGPGKKTEDSEELTPQQRDEIARKHRAREERKSALLKARDLDYPLRYVVVDPHCQQIVDIYNSSTDIVLIEQLYTDFMENSVFFQCQALRSLARAGTSNITIASDISSEAAAFLSGVSVEGGLGSTFGFNSSGSGNAPVRIPEKSTHLQLKALSDCVLGAATMINDSKMLNGSQFSTFVRCEAALALAQWQNERAPRSITTDAAVADSCWQALHILNQHIHSLFADPDSSMPLPSDFSNESSTHLRNAMLLAIATVKAKSGGSPETAVDTILKFASAGVEAEASPGSPQTGTSLEDGHYRAVLFYTLSQLRFESLALAKGSTTHPIYEIGALAMSAVSTAFTRARATARMKYTRGGANLLPSLSGDGIDVAAAISCLAAIDQHTVTLFAKGRAPPTSQLVHGGTTSGHSLKDVDRNGPSGRGPFTGLNYVKHFLPAEARLHCLVEDNMSAASNNVTQTIKDRVIHLLCTPVVRAAAFEGFIRLCFAMQYSHEERLRALKAQHNSSDSTSNTGINTTYVPAAVEALNAVLKYDPSAWVRQQAAFTFADVVMDRPPRIVPQALSLGSYWNCLAWSDPWATTLPQYLGGPAVGVSGASFLSPNAVVASGRECLQQGGKSDYTLIAMKLLWKHILSSLNYDQPVRQALLTVWKYCFEGRVPAVLSSSSSAADGKVADRIFGSVLPMDRLTIRSPNEEAQRMENLLKNGTHKVQRSGRVSIEPALAAAPVSSYGSMYSEVEQPFPAAGLQRQVSTESSGGGLRLSLSMNRPKIAPGVSSSGERGDTHYDDNLITGSSDTTTAATAQSEAAAEKRPTYKFII